MAAVMNTSRYVRICVCRVVGVVQYLVLYCPQLMSQPVGVFEDPTTGLVCLFKEEMLSFLYPASTADCLALERTLVASNKCVIIWVCVLMTPKI